MNQRSANSAASNTVEPTPRRTRLWSAREVATFLGMSLRWVRQAVSDGRLPCVRLPDARAVRFDVNVVKAWAAGHEHRLALARSAAAEQPTGASTSGNDREAPSALPDNLRTANALPEGGV
jgi:predicted DNA-binding transcriptional regulator AlpA